MRLHVSTKWVPLIFILNLVVGCFCFEFVFVPEHTWYFKDNITLQRIERFVFSY